MKKVIDFLKENAVTTIATSSGNKPRASIVEYCMVGDSLIFATSLDTIKAKNLVKNKNISVSVFGGAKYVTIDGVVTEPTKEETENYSKQIFAKHPELEAFIKNGTWGNMVYFKLIPQTAYFSDSAKGMVPPEIFKA